MVGWQGVRESVVGYLVAVALNLAEVLLRKGGGILETIRGWRAG